MVSLPIYKNLKLPFSSKFKRIPTFIFCLAVFFFFSSYDSGGMISKLIGSGKASLDLISSNLKQNCKSLISYPTLMFLSFYEMLQSLFLVLIQ